MLSVVPARLRLTRNQAAALSDEVVEFHTIRPPVDCKSKHVAILLGRIYEHRVWF